MSLQKIKLPEYFEVQLGNFTYSLDTMTLISSMSHQFISKTSNINSLDNYDIIYTVTRSEIEDYLVNLVENNINFIDLFGDWLDDFRLFHAKKNEPICRDVSFDFSDGSKWNIKLLDLLAYKNDNFDEDFDFNDPILHDDEKLQNWLSDLSWNEVVNFAEEVSRPQPEPNYEEEWKNCEKRIVKWNETIDILDFFEINDTIELEIDQDDKSL